MLDIITHYSFTFENRFFVSQCNDMREVYCRIRSIVYSAILYLDFSISCI